MFDQKRIVGATVATSAFLYSFCSLFTILFPSKFLLFVNNWFHTVDMFKIYPEGKMLVTPVNFLVGLLGVCIVSGFSSWLFIWVYRSLKK